jgi:hypothetical protein
MNCNFELVQIKVCINDLHRQRIFYSEFNNCLQRNASIKRNVIKNLTGLNS